METDLDGIADNVDVPYLAEALEYGCNSNPIQYSFIKKMTKRTYDKRNNKNEWWNDKIQIKVENERARHMVNTLSVSTSSYIVDLIRLSTYMTEWLIGDTSSA